MLNAVLATAAAERLTGDPLWLLVVSGPGNAKTETVQALSGAGALVTSTSRPRVRCCRRRHGRAGVGRLPADYFARSATAASWSSRM